jgi:hypothetical protein
VTTLPAKLYTIGDGNEIDVSPNRTLTMTLAEIQAAAQIIVVFNTLEEILTPEIPYAASAK